MFFDFARCIRQKRSKHKLHSQSTNLQQLRRRSIKTRKKSAKVSRQSYHNLIKRIEWVEIELQAIDVKLSISLESHFAASNWCFWKNNKIFALTKCSTNFVTDFRRWCIWRAQTFHNQNQRIFTIVFSFCYRVKWDILSCAEFIDKYRILVKNFDSFETHNWFLSIIATVNSHVLMILW